MIQIFVGLKMLSRLTPAPTLFHSCYMNQITTFYVFSKLQEKALPRFSVGGMLKKTLFAFFSTVLGSSLLSGTAWAATPPIRITEYMYGGSEFIEFTNTGNIPVNMAGWSFDDDSRVVGTVSLSDFGIIQPGQSVILSESPAETFRTHWNLCAQIKIIGDNSANLGRNDEINLFDAEGNLVDRLTYGDQNLPGTVRTDKHSAWVGESALGANDISGWTLSSQGDAEGSFASADAEYGSPGKSTRATVTFDPCDGGLPVTLVSFTAALKESAVELSWEIADYEDGTVFEVQRSFSGHHFETIRRLPAVSDRRRFSFRDENATAVRNILYYRLGITDADGKTEFSIIRAIETDGQGEMISLYPNPATSGALTVKTTGKKAVSLKVYNSLGIEQRRVEFKGITSFDTTNWPSGTYLLHFTTSGGQQFRRTMVVAN